MLVACGICTEVFVPTVEVYVTHCGHLFHYHCLLQWIESSETCPQCRTETNEDSMHQVYFNVQNSDGASDLGEMQNKIDDLGVQVRCRDIQINQHREEIEALAKENHDIRQEAATLQVRMKEKDTRHAETVARYVAIIENNQKAHEKMFKTVREKRQTLQKKLQKSTENYMKLNEQLQIYKNELTIAKQERSILFELLKTKQESSREISETGKHVASLERSVSLMTSLLTTRAPLTLQVGKKRLIEQRSLNLKRQKTPWRAFTAVPTRVSSSTSQPSTSGGLLDFRPLFGLDDSSSDSDDIQIERVFRSVREEETQTQPRDYLISPVVKAEDDDDDYNVSDAETEMAPPDMRDDDVGENEAEDDDDDDVGENEAEGEAGEVEMADNDVSDNEAE